MATVETISLILKDAMLTLLIAAAAAHVLDKERTKWFLILFMIIAISL